MTELASVMVSRRTPCERSEWRGHKVYSGQVISQVTQGFIGSTGGPVPLLHSKSGIAVPALQICLGCRSKMQNMW